MKKNVTFSVDYYTISEKGQSRQSRNTGLSQIQGAESETAVKAYLQRLHPGKEIQIQKLTFK